MRLAVFALLVWAAWAEAQVCEPHCRSGYICSKGQCVAAPPAPPPARPVTPAGSAATAAPEVAPSPAPATAAESSEDEAEQTRAPHVEKKRIKALWLTGLVVMLGMWAIRAGVTAAICASYSGGERGCDSDTTLGAAIPVVGAWLGVAQGSDPTAHGAGSANVLLLAASGLIETVGLATFVVGLFVKREVRVESSEPAVSVLPALDHPGLILSGRF